MKTKIIAVFHGRKVTLSTITDPRLLCNQGLSEAGMVKILEMVPTIEALGPFSSAYCSTMARALQTMSILVNELGIPGFSAVNALGQHASDNEGTIYYHPGFDENYEYWQSAATSALKEIATLNSERKVLVVAHRPTLLGVAARVLGITEEKAIEAYVNDANNPWVKQGYMVITLTDGEISIAPATV